VHYRTILDEGPDIGFFEIHAENYMGAGGPPHRYLEAIRSEYPISLHGVGLSIGSAGPLDRDHLMRLKGLVHRYQPGLFSEHLAWSSHSLVHVNDLLPLPYTEETLLHVARHVDEVQSALRCRVLLENPSTYVTFARSTIPEPDFLAALVRHTGCGILLDVNNAYVSATNHGYDAFAYVDAIPVEHVGEIHLAGHSASRDTAGRKLLIDTHGSAVSADVWSLYTHALRRLGPVPTLIEWDNDVPSWDELNVEAERADKYLLQAKSRTAIEVGNAVVAG
jgi:uncharacterized protein (UPF0276 family)